MSTTIVINPTTRISGFMEIEVKVENGRVTDAKSSGLLFRGFENMLIGRSPMDATYFTERICGICSSAHAVTSAMALEDSLKITPDENARILRDIIHGMEFLQNHIRHFYLYTLPDYVVTPPIEPINSKMNYDLRLPENLNKQISEHYLEAIRLSRLSHKGCAILGGKAPHTHGIFLGGVTESLDASRHIQIKATVSEIKDFVINKMVPDVHVIGEYYKEYYNMGAGYKNLMSYGVFRGYKEKDLNYVTPAISINGKTRAFEESLITENIYNSWYSGEALQKDMFLENTVDDMSKKEAYSWVKAPRYDGIPMEVGPLARMILSGNYENKISTMDRTIARVLEAKKVIETIEALLDRVILKEVRPNSYEMPDSAKGRGLSDTTRGALGHWVSIENKKISHYNIVTPSAWNCSPTDSRGVKGVIEQALIGTEIQDPGKPVEVGRIVRSYDPCISCATHVISDRCSPVEIII